jgi:hypothetical protein
MSKIRKFLLPCLLIISGILLVCGYLYPFLPASIASKWVQVFLPIGTSYDHTINKMQHHGWIVLSRNVDACRNSNLNRAELNFELGHFAFYPVPLVVHTYATLEFDKSCYLKAISIKNEADAP